MSVLAGHAGRMQTRSCLWRGRHLARFCTENQWPVPPPVPPTPGHEHGQLQPKPEGTSTPFGKFMEVGSAIWQLPIRLRYQNEQNIEDAKMLVGSNSQATQRLMPRLEKANKLICEAVRNGKEITLSKLLWRKCSGTSPDLKSLKFAVNLLEGAKTEFDPIKKQGQQIKDSVEKSIEATLAEADKQQMCLKKAYNEVFLAAAVALSPALVIAALKLGDLGTIADAFDLGKPIYRAATAVWLIPVGRLLYVGLTVCESETQFRHARQQLDEMRMVKTFIKCLLQGKVQEDIQECIDDLKRHCIEPLEQGRAADMLYATHASETIGNILNVVAVLKINTEPERK